MKSVGLDRPALGLILAFLAGVALFPWYMLQDGFWSFQWLSGYPLYPEHAPALFLLLQGKNLWLAPVVAIALAGLAASLAPLQERVRGELIGWLGLLGLVYMVCQGYGFGLQGWSFNVCLGAWTVL